MKSKLLVFFVTISTFCNAQNVYIPDANFKLALVSSNWQYSSIAKNSNGNNMTVDTNSDGEIQITEAQQVYGLNVTPNNSNNINSIEGINSFTNLKKIYCSSINLSTISLNGLPNLEELYITQCNLNNYSIVNCPILISIDFNYNQFTSLDFSSLPQLNSISCKNNNLTNLVVSGLQNLTYFDCSNNQLNSLNVQGLSNINGIKCDHNQISSLNLNGLNSLQSIEGQNNLLNSITLEGCTSLVYVYLSDNLLTFIDLNQCTSLNGLHVFNNSLLTAIFIKNGRDEYVGINSNNNVIYICCDEFQVGSLPSAFSNAEINTYCSFVSGGTYFFVNGNNIFDIANNGCTSLDPVYPNFKINFTDGITPKTLIPDNSGVYSIPVGTGSYTLTPILDNPTYYSVSPTTASVSFPANTSPAIRNFCITPNGIHHDLEISLIPITGASPGFDAKYKLIFKNKGNQLENGSLSFTVFNEDVLDYVSSNPAFNSQSTVSNTTTYVWNFTNLQQFETREIEIILNLNSPMETPALNMGDILHFSSSIYCLLDENLNDNTAILNQTVRNSFDPNDKTCLEGTTITPNMVGDYVHYCIRFENNGNANAQNVVVKDIIDTTKFDITTLIPIKGSHNFETRISNINKVEFIFQNINLPFDDANNDGYVTFKVKTKPNLVVGNTFSNLANIYFDYNFPIVTNNFITTVQNTLGLQEKELMNTIAIYPNPVKDILQFQTNEIILKVDIYDVTGRIISSNLVSDNKINLNELKTGNYFLKVFTEKDTKITKIVKE